MKKKIAKVARQIAVSSISVGVLASCTDGVSTLTQMDNTNDLQVKFYESKPEFSAQNLNLMLSSLAQDKQELILFRDALQNDFNQTLENYFILDSYERDALNQWTQQMKDLAISVIIGAIDILESDPSAIIEFNIGGFDGVPSPTISQSTTGTVVVPPTSSSSQTTSGTTSNPTKIKVEGSYETTPGGGSRYKGSVEVTC